jgi:hypothetical protein
MAPYFTLDYAMQWCVTISQSVAGIQLCMMVRIEPGAGDRQYRKSAHLSALTWGTTVDFDGNWSSKGKYQCHGRKRFGGKKSR